MHLKAAKHSILSKAKGPLEIQNFMACSLTLDIVIFDKTVKPSTNIRGWILRKIRLMIDKKGIYSFFKCKTSHVWSNDLI